MLEFALVLGVVGTFEVGAVKQMVAWSLQEG